MKIESTSIEGVFKLSPNDPMADLRGSFDEAFHLRELDARIGREWKGCQENRAMNIKNYTLRGIHVAPWSKIERVTHGEARIVLIDARVDSETFKKSEKFGLNVFDGVRLFIPPGVGNSYYTLEPMTLVEYEVDAYWRDCYNQKIVERRILWNDPELNISWPDLDFTISDQDKQNPTLEQYLDNNYHEEISKNSQLLI